MNTFADIAAQGKRAEIRLSDLERKLVILVRVLQQTGKQSILIVTPDGEIQVFRGERAGLIPAP